MEGTHEVLDGSFITRQKAIEKCGTLARMRGYRVFAIQDGGWCASGSTAHKTYKRYGTADNCVSGKGGANANDVYIMNSMY